MRTISSLVILFIVTQFLNAEVIIRRNIKPLEKTHNVKIEINSINYTVGLEDGKYIQDWIISNDQKFVFVSVYRKNARSGEWFDSLRRYPIIEGSVDSLTAYKAIEIDSELTFPNISRILDISDSGDRLLVDVHYVSNDKPNSRLFETYPCFIDITSGSLTKVRP